jgi:hypothetical protein
MVPRPARPVPSGTTTPTAYSETHSRKRVLNPMNAPMKGNRDRATCSQAHLTSNSRIWPRSPADPEASNSKRVSLVGVMTS